jgi:EAL domain-containing protein (putative c-di-GMP-specific phosphodiesterase class I)
MSVNLSAPQFDHSLPVAQIKDVLHETGIDPSTLRLEITERNDNSPLSPFRMTQDADLILDHRR